MDIIMVNMIDGIHSYMSYDSRISDSFDQMGITMAMLSSVSYICVDNEFGETIIGPCIESQVCQHLPLGLHFV